MPFNSDPLPKLTLPVTKPSRVSVALLPTFIAGTALREGALRVFLAGYKAPSLTLHAVYPPTQHLAVKVRLFIDFLVGRFSGVPPWDIKV